MADKYLYQNSGTLTEREALIESLGAASAGKIPATDASGRLHQSLMPVGIGADTAAIAASEALGNGDLVNVWNDAGTAKVRKADGSAVGKEAHGFVLAAVASGANATVYFEGPNTQATALTPGVQYLSDTTPGKTVAVAPAGAGKVVQRVGFAYSETAFNFEPANPIVLA